MFFSRISFLLLAFLWSTTVFSQQFPSFKLLRYEEDYTNLKNKSHLNSYEKIKYIPILKDSNTFVSLGGEARLQYFYLKNENWGEEPKDKNGYVMRRYLLHADLRAGKRFRTFMQLQSSLINGKQFPSPVEENPLEIHQAFIDVIPFMTPTKTFTVRLGRQELMYGSQRLVSVRENPNNRQSFDAVRIILQNVKSKIEFFYGNYVTARMDNFNDRSTKDLRLWGAYYTHNDIPLIKNIDLYYFGLVKKQSIVNDADGRETRHSVGTRLWDSKNNWKYDAETLYQFGTFAGREIRAWTASLNTSLQFASMKFKPEIGLKTEIISGDLQKNDGKIQTFNPLFPKGAYFGLAALIGPSNITDIHPSINFELVPKLNFAVDYDIFWRYSRNDGIYAVNMKLIYPDNNSRNKHIGNQMTGTLIFAPNKFINMRSEFTWFQSGEYLKEVGPGKDVIFTGMTAQFRF